MKYLQKTIYFNVPAETPWRLEYTGTKSVKQKIRRKSNLRERIHPPLRCHKLIVDVHLIKQSSCKSYKVNYSNTKENICQ